MKQQHGLQYDRKRSFLGGNEKGGGVAFCIIVNPVPDGAFVVMNIL